jgi:ATP-dependent RNA helicase SUPV3L1/SUV3
VSEDKADAIATEAAMDAVEGAAESVAADTEAAQVETATADLGAPPPDADKTAEPEFDEVWFPGGRRPDNPRHEKRQRHQRPPTGGTPPGAEAAAPAADGAQPERKPFRRPDRDKTQNGKPPRRFDNGSEGKGGKPKFSGKRGGGDREDWKQHQPRPKRDTPLDPDSPWAALAALRNPKQE